MAFAELRAQPAIGRLSSVGETKKSAGFSLPPAFSLRPSRLHRRCPLGCTLPMAQEQNFTPVQYSGNLCGNWHQECARLYGHRTYRWQQCMQQPQALEDCGRGGYRGYRGQTSSSQCGNWHRECARLVWSRVLRMAAVHATAGSHLGLSEGPLERHRAFAQADIGWCRRSRASGRLAGASAALWHRAIQAVPIPAGRIPGRCAQTLPVRS